MRTPKILLLDDNDDMRTLMARYLKLKTGADCLSLSRFNDLENHAAEVMDQDIAILDINLGHNEPSGLDAFRWLRDHNFRGQIVFLTAHAKSHPLVRKSCELSARVFEKPISPERLLEIVQPEPATK